VKPTTEAFGLASTRAVQDRVANLSAKGLIEHKREPGSARPWKLTAAGWRELGLKDCRPCKGTGKVRL
jgi:hypothetical protein